MPISVKLRDVAEQMEMLGDESAVYLNKRTGEFVTVTEEDRRALEEPEDSVIVPAWQRELLPKIREALDSDDYLALPDKFEIHEWSIMERFAASVDDEGCSEALSDAIHGSGAFRRFKDTICRLGVEDDWYRFRDRALEEIAAGWLEENGIPFERNAGHSEDTAGGAANGKEA